MIEEIIYRSYYGKKYHRKWYGSGLAQCCGCSLLTNTAAKKSEIPKDLLCKQCFPEASQTNKSLKVDKMGVHFTP